MKIIFQPEQKECEIATEENLLQAAGKAGVLLDGNCGGTGICGKCKIKVLSGNCTELTAEEIEYLSEKERKEGYRLACKTFAKEDLVVEIPDFHKGSERKKNMMKLPEGFLLNPCVKDIDKKTGQTGCYGMAFDIGTTTVVGMLWNLADGSMVDVTAGTNPQSLYGADVISRIQFCKEKEENLSTMQKITIDCLNDMITELTQKNKLDKKDIYDMTVVGNTTMSHLFLGVSPESLARLPFTPVFYEMTEKMAKELGLEINEEAKVCLLPNIAGHVGSDISAVLLATGLKEKKGANLAIDIGTNGEILLAKDGKVLTCSTAAGPAFEGASIQMGMRASDGAIEKVRIDNNNVTITTIGDKEPIGICGSGLIDSVAELLKAGIVEESGRMLKKEEALSKGIAQELADRIQKGEKGMFFILSYQEDGEDIVLTQQDIREVQLAKGAIYAGIKTLMKQLEVTEEDLESLILAGAFGNYIEKDSALAIGLLPDISKERIHSVGNAAGVGACMALLSKEARELVQSLAKETEHVELSMNMDFQEEYIYAMNFSNFQAKQVFQKSENMI